MPFGIQPIHLIAILIVALIIFGPSRLPEIGRGLGKAITEFRKGTHEMTESFREEMSRPTGDENHPISPAPIQSGAGNFCPSCGTPNPSTARFCNSCGNQLPVQDPARQ